MTKASALLLIATIVFACLSSSVLFAGTYLEFGWRGGGDPDDVWILAGVGAVVGLIGLFACLFMYVVRHYRKQN